MCGLEWIEFLVVLSITHFSNEDMFRELSVDKMLKCVFNCMELCSLTCDCDILFQSKCNVIRKSEGGEADWHGVFKDAHKCV
jgi:hypothetical protein